MVEVDERLIWCLEQGLSASEALDYWATTAGSYTQGEWAKIRGVGRQAVNNNCRQAEAKLQSY